MLDLLLICVDSPQAAAKYIKYLVCMSFTRCIYFSLWMVLQVQQQDLSGSNSPSHHSISAHPFILQAVQCLPQTGRVKSHTLLSQFKSKDLDITNELNLSSWIHICARVHTTFITHTRICFAMSLVLTQYNSTLD